MIEFQFTSLQDFLKKNIWLILGIFSFVLGIVSSATGIFLYLQEKHMQINPSDVIQSSEVQKENDEIGMNENKEHIVVFVAGAVKKPGLYELQNGLRLADAVSAAGGLTKEASLRHLAKHMNMASQIEDGSSFYIPREDEVEQEPVTDVQTKKSETQETMGEGTALGLNINTATTIQLDSLEGIGAARAEQIISNRPYTDFSDFAERSGLSQALVQQIRNQITF